MTPSRWLKPALALYAAAAVGVLAVIIAGAIWLGRTR